MKFLLDTNIVLPLEPVLPQGITPDANAAMELARLITESGNQSLLHPLVRADIANDADVDRRRVREQVLAKYSRLVDPPPITAKHQVVIGSSIPGSNDWVDDHLLVAVERNAVDYLVTQDQRIHRKATRVGVSERVLTVAGAVALLRALFDVAPPPPPAVTEVKLYNVDEKDPIFDGFRADYPGFDEWLKKAKRQDRPSWAIYSGTHLAAICIVKREDVPVYGTIGKILKICSFKVADTFVGARFGELLLKTVFSYADANKFDWLFVTVFDKHALLTKLFQDFGFESQSDCTPLGELVLTKPMAPTDATAEKLDPLAYAVRFGPCRLKWYGTAGWIVPIQPRYANVLFPEQQPQTSLFAGQYAFGNSIRKAYLCHSNVRKLRVGEFLAFYRSQDAQAITTLGVIEDTMRSGSAENLGQFVSRRTVYTMAEIRQMCAREREVLAIKFRQVLARFDPITSAELTVGSIWRRPPQSLMQFPSEKIQWLQERIGQ